MSDVIKSLADILKNLPSEFREDYPKSVPNYVIDGFTKFNDRYKRNVQYLKTYFEKLEKENAKSKELLKTTLGALCYHSRTFNKDGENDKFVYEKFRELQSEVNEFLGVKNE